MNNFCLFYKNDSLNLGWIREFRKNKFLILPLQGKEFFCSSSQTEYSWHDPQNFSDQNTALTFLQQKERWLQNQIPLIDLQTIYELCIPEQPYSIDDIAEFALTLSQNIWDKISLLIALKQNQRFFQQRKKLFYPRSLEKLKEFDDQIKRKEIIEIKKQLENQWAEQLRIGHPPLIKADQQEFWDNFLQRLYKFLLYINLSAEKKYFCEIFHWSIKEPEIIERQGVNHLILAGKKVSWGKLLLDRANIQQNFTDQYLNEIDRIKNENIWENVFQNSTIDQRNLLCYTVDNETTTDYDDAISYENLNQKHYLRLHIADVASFILPETPIFEAALLRISSIYTLKKTFHMLPKILSEDYFSLVEGEDRAVMTFELEIDRHGYEINWQIYRSIINVKANLTYDKVDEKILNNDIFWNQIYHFCSMHEENRLLQGALKIKRSELKLNINNPNHIQLSEVNLETPAHNLVQELAIWINQNTAKFCYDNKIPILYRTQPPYSVTAGVKEDQITMLDVQIKPACISLYPSPHHGLGVNQYIQITSPIRRFNDLICQYIMWNVLSLQKQINNLSPNQESSWKMDDNILISYIKQIEDQQQIYQQLERNLAKHWKYKYLTQNQEDLYQAVFIRYLKNKKALILIIKLQLFIEADISLKLKEKDIITIKIQRINANYHQISIIAYSD